MKIDRKEKKYKFNFEFSDFDDFMWDVLWMFFFELAMVGLSIHKIFGFCCAWNNVQ